jgi:hypothetical protein
MIGKPLILMVVLALRSMAAQAPPVPNEHASDTAKAKVALHRATRFRGEVVNPAVGRNPNAATPATPAVRATPAQPSPDAAPAAPAVPATPAVPAIPAHKGGQSGSHRP